MNNLSIYSDKIGNYDSLPKEEQQQLLVDLYNKENLSWIVIAELLGKNANTVRRQGNKFGIKSKTREEAQKAALASGRQSHPTEGTTRSQEVKTKISKKVGQYWDSVPEEVLKQKSEKAKELWDAKSDSEIKMLQDKAHAAIRQTALEGSRLEKFLLDKLVKNGFRVEFHREQVIVREKLQIDIFLPELNVAIEVDGPSHSKNIWGQKALSKNVKRDRDKTGLLLGRGMCVVRVKHLKDFSNYRGNLVWDRLYKELNKIKDKFPPVSERQITIQE